MFEQEQIDRSHPMVTGHHNLYDQAVDLVMEREKRSELALLVNHLLYELHKQRIKEPLNDHTLELYLASNELLSLNHTQGVSEQSYGETEARLKAAIDAIAKGFIGETKC